jgi:ubiquinone/menaquinone biosynthesis C-methylase UbiE
MIRKIIDKQIVRALGYGRLGLYSLESLPLIKARKKQGLVNKPDPAPPHNHIKILQKTISQLIEKDIQNIKNELYPRKLVYPENPLIHILRYLRIYLDNLNALKRVRSKKNKEFSREAKKYIDDLPDYYKRNFHNQTDGYLSENSADLYAHQTEILFKGSTSLMRRILLGDVIEYIKSKKKHVNILEIGSGTGETTEILLKSCPQISITAVEISKPYINNAKESLKEFDNVKFVNENFENFYTNKKFDIVISGFLFHEVPLKVRENILNIAHAFLKKRGRAFHIDSLQMGDQKKLDWALIQFPKDFHEPFYKAYVNYPLEKSLSSTLSLLPTQTAFLAKCVTGEKL